MDHLLVASLILIKRVMWDVQECLFFKLMEVFSNQNQEEMVSSTTIMSIFINITIPTYKCIIFTGIATNISLNDCSQICINTFGSFVCECNIGYQLSDDLKTCLGM